MKLKEGNFSDKKPKTEHMANYDDTETLVTLTPLKSTLDSYYLVYQQIYVMKNANFSLIVLGLSNYILEAFIKRYSRIDFICKICINVGKAMASLFSSRR